MITFSNSKILYLHRMNSYQLFLFYYLCAMDVSDKPSFGDIRVRSDLFSSKTSVNPIAFRASSIPLPMSLPIRNLGNLKFTVSV